MSLFYSPKLQSLDKLCDIYRHLGMTPMHLINKKKVKEAHLTRRTSKYII